uniref:DUF4352 domain-containing protein n=1 Tax=Dictyoglomus thermophilum TaxID=14 RepID=A0A7C3MIW9_DICTH
MKKAIIILVLFIIPLFSIIIAEDISLTIQGKEVKGENIDGLIFYISKIDKLEALPFDSSNIKPEKNHVFYIFEIYVLNKTNKELLIKHDNFRLINDDGIKIPISTLGAIYYGLRGQEVFFMRYIKPNEMKSGLLIFELNKNNTPYKLKILDIPNKGKNYTISLKI